MENIKNIIRAEIERRRDIYLGHANACIGTNIVDGLDEALSFLDTLPEQPAEGLDVTDFCKPIDPGIAQCVADHWWEMIGEESTNKPTTEGLEEAADAHIRRVVDAAGHPGWDWETQDVKDAFIAGAEWQYQKDRGEFAKLKAKEWSDGYNEGIAKGKEKMMEEFEKNRLAACDAQTEEEYERETDFAYNFIEEHHRMPTFNDAINYGAEWQKAKMMEEAMEGEVEENYLDEDGVHTCVLLGRHFNPGDEVYVIKKENGTGI